MIKFENHANGRYYYLYVETDLFGDNVLHVIRGGRKYPPQSRAMASGAFAAIESKIQALIKIRLRRGYTLVN